MTRLIAVNGIKVEKGLCTVAFRVWPKFQGTDLAGQCMEVTHDKLYAMLDRAVKVEEPKTQSGKFAVLDMGNGITIDVWEKK